MSVSAVALSYVGAAPGLRSVEMKRVPTAAVRPATMSSKAEHVPHSPDQGSTPSQEAAVGSIGDSRRPAAVRDGDLIDRDLMLRVAARDRHAFSLLASRHSSAALGVAQRIVRNIADAEEVVQESLTRLWVFADRWDPDTARFTSWFYRIVTNQAISRLRRKTMDPIDAIDEPPDGAPSPHDRLAGREIGIAIGAAVARLPPRQRAAVALCYDEGLSCAEAAEAMGVSVGTMESLLFRARRSLREWLGPISAELEEGS